MLQIGSVYKTIKSRENRVRVTIGGDRLENKGNKTAIPENLTTIKIHLNSAISTKKAR